MAVNMTSLINQELAKIEKRNRAFGRSVDPAMDAFSEAWKMGQEQKVWNERKNEQMRSMVDLRTQGYNAEFSNDRLDKDISKYESWFKSNQGSFDAVTMDYAQLKLDQMKEHRSDNEEFDGLEGQIGLRKEKMFKMLDTIDKSGEKLTADDINLIRESNQEWLTYTRNMQKRFGDRLNMKTFDYLQNDLNEAVGMNTFLLQSAKDDGWIDEYEYTAFKDSWDQLDPTPILTYLKKEDTHDRAVTDGLEKRIDAVADDYAMLNKFVAIGDKESEGQYPSPDGTMMLNWGDLDTEQQIEYLDKKNNLKKQIEGWDDQYKSLNIGVSLIDKYVPDFYKDVTPPTPPGKKKPPIKEPPKTLGGFDKRMKALQLDKTDARSRNENMYNMNLRMSQAAGMKRRYIFADYDEKRAAGFKYDKDTSTWTSWEDVEISQALIDHMESRIKNIASKWGVERALNLKKLWQEFLKTRKSFDNNKTAEEIDQEILELKKQYIG